MSTNERNARTAKDPARNKRLSPDKRWPDKWCMKGRIWDPKGYSVEVIRSLPPESGPVLLDLMCRHKFTPAMLAALTDYERAAAEKNDPDISATEVGHRPATACAGADGDCE